MAFLMEKDKALNPMDIRLFSPETEMPATADD